MKTSNKDWEKEFKDKFNHLGCSCALTGGIWDKDDRLVTHDLDDIKLFISDLLLQHNKEIIEKIKGKKHTMAHIEGAKRVEQDYIFLEDLFSLLEESGEKV